MKRRLGLYLLVLVLFSLTGLWVLIKAINGADVTTPAATPYHPTGSISFEPRDHGGESGVLVQGKKMAYAITVTKDGPYLDGAAILYESILSVNSKFEFEMIAIIHPGVVTTREPLKAMGYKLIEFDPPITSSEIEGKHLRETIDKSGCCGALELLKLCAFQLEQYHRVLLLDMDSMLVKNIDHLFTKEKSLIFTWDHAMDGNGKVPPVQGGFLLLKPSKVVYSHLIDIVREGDFRPGTGWGGTHIGWCWGGQTVQGLLAYYFGWIQPTEGLPIDPCAYNSMATTKNCSAVAPEYVKTFHFTACQKPWECHLGHPYICAAMHTHWWELRARLEHRNKLPITPRCCNNNKVCPSRHYKPLARVSFLRQQNS